MAIPTRNQEPLRPLGLARKSCDCLFDRREEMIASELLQERTVLEVAAHQM
jgi:hypothetical protein